MTTDTKRPLLREKLCAAFCSFYKPGNKEELSCLGYEAVAWLAAGGREIGFAAGGRPRGADTAVLLSERLCPHCPFFAADCDYAAGVEGAPPCGGYILLERSLGDGIVSADDLVKYERHLRIRGRHMQIYDVAKTAGEEGGEYVLGAADLHTHACYLIYGVIGPGEKGREIRPGGGHEEIFCLVSGSVSVRRDGLSIRLQPGKAFHLRGEDFCTIDNEGDSEAVYVISGGHSGEGGHH